MLKEHLGKASQLLGAMGNDAPLRILCRLAEGEIAVGTLASDVGLSQFALSQHLSKFRSLGLVHTRRESQTIFYSCDHVAIMTILDALESIFCER